MSVRFRVTWALLSVFLVECLVCGLAMLPGALLWQFFALRTYPFVLVRIVVLSMAFVPADGLFAFSLMVLSALSTRWLGWRTPVNVEMPIKALEWPLLCWVRYMVSVHVVRLFAGSVFRATPLWTFDLRLNGARLGRGVYVNSLAINDHNLLEFSDRVVIGDGVHLSGHTVEHGIVRVIASTGVRSAGCRSVASLEHAEQQQHQADQQENVDETSGVIDAHNAEQPGDEQRECGLQKHDASKQPAKRNVRGLGRARE